MGFYYNPTCVWCGEPENDEQGAVELVGPDGHYHDDCYATELEYRAVDRFERRPDGSIYGRSK